MAIALALILVAVIYWFTKYLRKKISKPNILISLVIALFNGAYAGIAQAVGTIFVLENTGVEPDPMGIVRWGFIMFVMSSYISYRSLLSWKDEENDYLYFSGTTL